MRSAQAFLQGLYPPVGAQLSLDTLRNGRRVEAPMDGYQLIPVQTTEEGAGSEDSPWLVGTSGCANAQISSNQYFSSDEYREILERTEPFSQTLTPAVNDTFKGDDVSDGKAFLKRHGVHLPRGGLTDKEAMTRDLFIHMTDDRAILEEAGGMKRARDWANNWMKGAKVAQQISDTFGDGWVVVLLSPNIAINLISVKSSSAGVEPLLQRVATPPPQDPLPDLRLFRLSGDIIDKQGHLSTSFSLVELLECYQDGDVVNTPLEFRHRNKFGADRAAELADARRAHWKREVDMQGRGEEVKGREELTDRGKNKLGIQLGNYSMFLGFLGPSRVTSANSDFYGFPDYPSTLTFELFTSTAPSPFPCPEDLQVRMLWHNGTVSRNGGSGNFTPTAYPLFGQTVTSLPWTTFVEEMSKFAIQGTDEWCLACGNTTGKCAGVIAKASLSAGPSAATGIMG
ncbi:MAG: hypothetical protein M1823_003533 [Watsoniomyces obsoletus]|nr:MAG: hypothetical protein M1823_003533 [Watsoniomyces obsoletus]